MKLSFSSSPFALRTPEQKVRRLAQQNPPVLICNGMVEKGQSLVTCQPGSLPQCPFLSWKLK
jgi:hypothetical protein